MNEMTIRLPMTGRPDKELFPCDCYPEAQAWRVRSTFWDDFSLAEAFDGLAGVKSTWRRAFREWRDDAKYLCELAVVTNHKCWKWHRQFELAKAAKDSCAEQFEELSHYYADRYHEACAYAFRDGNTFTDEERSMIYEVLD